MAFCDFCRREKHGPICVASYRVRVYKHRSWLRRLLGFRPRQEVLNACSRHRMDTAGGGREDLAKTTRDILRAAYEEWS
jgi:hypothetical protein